MEEQRRFRLPAQHMPAFTNFFWHAAQSFPPIALQKAAVDDRSATLRAVLAEVDTAICPSNFLKQTYLAKGFQARRMHFLRQGLVHIPLQSSQKSPSEQLRIGYIGQIAPHKGVHVLVDAFLRLGPAAPQAQLKLYGDTSQFPDFYRDLQRKAVHEAGQQIQFMGPFNNQQISQVYEELDVLVVPSIWYENSPNVILEAFAHQTPVITSNLGGMAELVADDETGLLFTANDAADLAKKLKMILDNPDRLSNLRKNIQPPATLETEMAQLAQIYQSVLTH
jgi:glycosyltransferase involved in cell wall biosynthesis